MSLEITILKYLTTNDDYSRRVLPFLKDEYFESEYKVLFKEIKNFIINYNMLPNSEALNVALDCVLDGPSDSEIESAKKIIGSFSVDNALLDMKWLEDHTEQFCQDRALYLSMSKALEIMNGKGGSLKKTAIPAMLSDALAISFDTNIGHDYLEQSDHRYEFYHKIDEKIPWDLELFNKITKNGLSKKTLNLAIAGTHVGKTLLMTHMAAAHLTMGKNVLYITLEMSEEKISERIDANLMNINLYDIESLPKETFDKKIKAIKTKTTGTLIVKEYPMTSVNTLHIKNLLNELKLKKKFIPDILYVDYLNLLGSFRFKAGMSMYEYVKGVSEELRGLAVEYNMPVMTATQLNRVGFQSSDVGMEHTSESFGVPMVADFMFAMTVNDELKKMNQIQIIQLKNRYADMGTYTRFMIGVDRAKMKLYDAESSAQQGLSQSGQLVADTPVFDNTTTGRQQLKDKFKSLQV